MTYAAGVDQMSEQDMADAAAYLVQIDVPRAAPVDVKVTEGDVKAGVKQFRECKSCHGSDGMAKPADRAPRLAGLLRVRPAWARSWSR